MSSLKISDDDDRKYSEKVNLNDIDDGDCEQNMLTIAIEGCAHGALDKIYEAVLQSKDEVDLLICCGDFQALRNENDLDSMAVPDKFKDMGDFYKYYKGEKKVPVPTIFIGGNHEASLYMQELFYGGWAAPDIYYMGAANVIKFGGVRIGGKCCQLPQPIKLHLQKGIKLKMTLSMSSQD